MDFALFEAVKNFNYLTGDSKLDDDFVDRINRYWSALIMVLFAIILSAKQIVGEPLKCWTPAEFKDPWIQYAEDYCWVKNTYFVPKSENLPDGSHQRQQQELGYYQWIPYVMALQAFMYYLPAMIWRMLNWKAGLDLTSIVSRASNGTNLPGIGFQIATNLHLRSMSEKNDFFLQRHFLTFLYLFTKLLYAANAIVQFLFLSSFFGRALDSLFVVTRDFATGAEWHETGHFPRITFCDFSVRRLGQVQSYTVQCVLTINIFTEKIFVVAGYWMLLVALLTFVNTFSWFTALLLPWRRSTFVENLLPNLDKRQRQNFLDYFVRYDGVLVFHLISDNSDEAVASKVLGMVYDAYEDYNANNNNNDDNVDGGNDFDMAALSSDSPTDLEKDRDATLQLPSRSAQSADV